MKIIAVDVSPFEDDDRLVAENIRNEAEGFTMVFALNAANGRSVRSPIHDPFMEYKLVEDSYELKKRLQQKEK